VPVFDAAHWRKRAEEARAFAEQIKDHAQRARVLKSVEKYEQLAKYAEVHGTAASGGRGGKPKRGKATKVP
jgi:hypothetical protein